MIAIRSKSEDELATSSNADSPAPFSHWMLREIHEQPATLAATLEHYLDGDGFAEALSAPVLDWLKQTPSRIVIAASGSSRHAGLVAELLVETLSGIAVDVEYASEFCYRSEKGLGDASVMVVSQSGETADTLSALRKANQAGHRTLAITNVPTSTMAREATVSFPTCAGRERAIPATKSFTTQLLNLHLLSLLAAVSRGALSAEDLAVRLNQARELPAKIEAQLAGWVESVREIAGSYGDARSFLFLGRGPHYPIAREGALKLKESAYLHAEGYPAGELKHGPNALVAEGTPLVMVATVDRSEPESVERYEKLVQLLRDMRQQGANIIAVANTGDTTVAELATRTIFVDEMPEALLAIAEIVPLQLFSYFMAINNGIDVDRPRNLSKAVLAE
jgi:glucosamine--fructose-6-phosphate aminotransferase (isomerizing)